MSETVSVNFSGPALAFLLYENVKSSTEQEGFLLGETNVIVTKTITDSDSSDVKLHKVININAVIPCPKTCAFYCNDGKIDVQKLENILGMEIPNVVAWFRYEPTSKFKLSLRDKLIHKELSTSGLFPIPTDLFSCCLLYSSTSHMESTYAYTHKFVRCRNNQFINVPMHISNLGESNNCYKPKVHASKPFSDLCQTLGIPKKGMFDLKLIDKIQDRLYKEISAIMNELSESECIKEQMEQEYDRTQREIEYHSSLLEQKAIAEAKEEEERRKEEEESQLLNVILLDINKSAENSKSDEEISTVKNLKNDLDVNKEENDKTKSENGQNSEKTEINSNVGNCSSDTSNNSYSENLIDLTTEESEEEFNNERKSKMSYAQIIKKKQ